MVCQVTARYGAAGEVRSVTSWSGAVRLVEARFGEVWQARHGAVRTGMAMRGAARLGMAGGACQATAGPGKAWQGRVWHGRRGLLGYGGVRIALVWRGAAGKVRSG